ncbi:MAG: hydroxyacid dehydrogenase [Legionella sp.]|nr:MAG: hydroxyacid dehydrogenase [Legionella sp.]PJD99549.1 MAG: hydroxyacid dehydrogenase [Legionella sp.]
MKIAIYNTKDYERVIFNTIEHKHNFVFMTEPLSLTTVEKAKGFDGISCFVTDCLNSAIINKLADYKIKLIALRSAGFDHVDLDAARLAGITVVRVPKYSPEAIAEFAVGLILILNRKILTSYLQGLNNNFALDGLVGFNLYKKTVGVIGTGNIGTAFVRIMNGFGCRLLAVDPEPNDICRKLNVNYVSLDYLLRESDIISLHCPLNDQTMHFIDKEACAKVKKNAMLINTGRGALCDTQALVHALESGNLGYAGLDVYEKEQDLFFKDRSGEIIHDELFLKLRSLPNVLITPHQAFLTQEAIENIIRTTVSNMTSFEQGNLMNQVC